MATTAGFVLLLLILAHQAASQKALYGFRGRAISMSIGKSLPLGTITSVIWRHNRDLAVEWFVDGHPIYYGDFKYIATLNITTGTLNISHLQPRFDGTYYAEVNDVDVKDPVNLTVIDAEVYGVKGQSITLAGKVPETGVKYAQWDLNGSVIADWGAEDGQTNCFPNMEFNGNALIISELTSNCSGNYAFKTDIEHKAMVYHLIVVDVMLIPQISKQCNSTGCLLKCTVLGEGNAQATWTRSTGGDMPGPLWVDSNEPVDFTYTCNSPMSSIPISLKDLFRNTATAENPTSIHALIALVVVLIVG